MAAGQDPAAFWGLTPRVIATVLKGSAERQRREHNERAWQAHQTAFLTKYAPDRPGAFPKLAKLQQKAMTTENRGRAKGWEADFAAAAAWAGRRGLAR